MMQSSKLLGLKRAVRIHPRFFAAIISNKKWDSFPLYSFFIRVIISGYWQEMVNELEILNQG